MYQLLSYYNFDFYLPTFFYLDLELKFKFSLKSFVISKTYRLKSA